MNLTIDKKDTSETACMAHSLIDVQIDVIFCPCIFLLFAVKAHLTDENETGLGISELSVRPSVRLSVTISYCIDRLSTSSYFLYGVVLQSFWFSQN